MDRKRTKNEMKFEQPLKMVLAAFPLGVQYYEDITKVMCIGAL